MSDICQGCQAQVEKGFRYVSNEGGTPARFLIVGEAPGHHENEEGRPFVGQTGRLLRRTLRSMGVRDWAMTNAVRVRPGTGNPDPRMGWIRQCRRTCMARTLDEVQPEVIVCMGTHALRSFTDDGNITLTKHRHQVFWYEHDGRRIPVIATWHPSYVEREKNAYDWWISDLEAYFIQETWRFRKPLNSTYRVMEQLTPAARNQNRFIVDVETTGLEPWNGNRLRMVGIRPQGSVTNIITGTDGGQGVLRDLLMDESITLTGWNMMFDAMWGLKDREIPKCKVEDGMYLHYLLDERYPIRGLKHQARLYTPYEPIDLPRGGIDFSDEEVVPYCADDVGLTDLTVEGIKQELATVGVRYEKCAQLYGRAIPILAGMTRTGIPVDKEVLHAARIAEQARVDSVLEVLAQIWNANAPCAMEECPTCDGFGTCSDADGDRPDHLPQGQHPIEDTTCGVCGGEGYWWRHVAWDPRVLNRSHELSDFIFEVLGLDVPSLKGARRKDGRGSTSREVLEAVLEASGDPSGFLQGLFDYRDVNDNLKKYVLDVEDRVGRDGRIRPRFNIVTRADRGGPEGTTSGRMSVSKPGLHSTPNGHPMRRAFVPLPGDTHLFQIDRSQAELTDLAQLTKDRNLVRLINQQTDQHQRMADMATAAGYPMARPEAKTVNFGILYGIGPKGLEQRTRFDAKAGKQFIDLWFGEYADVRAVQREVHYLALKRGWVETMYGRRRNFPLGLNGRSQDGGKAQRQAFNFMIQATANDLNMLFLVEWCKRDLHELAFPIFCIHDAVLFSTADPGEVLFEVDKGYKTWYADAVEEFLGEELDVVLRADAKMGPNWGTMTEENDQGEKNWWFSTHVDEGHQDYEAIP